jgi:hypothetical protein
MSTQCPRCKKYAIKEFPLIGGGLCKACGYNLPSNFKRKNKQTAEEKEQARIRRLKRLGKI